MLTTYNPSHFKSTQVHEKEAVLAAIENSLAMNLIVTGKCCGQMRILPALSNIVQKKCQI